MPPGKYIRTELTRQKLREASTGRSAANKGISNIDFYGKEKAEEMRKKQSEKGPGTSRRGLSDIEFYGPEKAKIIRDKISKAVSRAKRLDTYGGRGYVKKDPNSKQDYRFTEWATAVKTRDNFTCQGSGPHKGRLQAHHIKDWENFPLLRYVIDNGLTLCLSCHGREHGVIDKQIRIAFQKAFYLIKCIELTCPCNSVPHSSTCLIGKLSSIIEEAASLPHDRGQTVNPIKISVDIQEGHIQ